MSRIATALAAHAVCMPERKAITGSILSMNWRELNAEVMRLAGEFGGVRVLGLLMTNSPAWIVTDLAALQAGCTLLPLPQFFSDRQLHYAVAEAWVDTLITDDPDRIQRLFPEARCESLFIAGMRCGSFSLRDVAAQIPLDTSRITYTSGTTGFPKGVQLNGHALEAVADSLCAAVNAHPDDRALVLLPLSILLENIGSVYAPILAGAEIIVPAAQESGISGSGKAEPARLAAMLQRYRPTTMIVPPALLKLLVELGQRGLLPDSLRFIGVGSAPVGQALLQAAAEIGLPVFQGYGLSEACSVVALNTPGSNRPGSVGKPLPHCRVRIASNGEIRMRGVTYTGYVNSTTHASNTDLCTGDYGHFDEDGYLYVTGRLNDRIITPLGRNVAPEWVESELVAHPDIMQAAVLGNGMPHLSAVLVARPGTPVKRVGQAVDAVNVGLPDYARVEDWMLADAPFSPENGAQTPAGTLRRAVIEQYYATRFGSRPAFAQ